MPQYLTPPFPPVNASSAITNINLLKGLASNFLASTTLGTTNANLLTGYMSNLVNSSGVLNATSATLMQTTNTSYVTSVNTYVSSSALPEGNQILGASSTMAVMLTQSQNGFQISS